MHKGSHRENRNKGGGIHFTKLRDIIASRLTFNVHAHQ